VANGWIDQDETWHAGRPRPGHIVLHGHQALPYRRGTAPPPIFGPYMLWTSGWMDQDVTWYGCSPRPKGHCVRWGASSPPQKGGRPFPIFGLFLLWPNG